MKLLPIVVFATITLCASFVSAATTATRLAMLPAHFGIGLKNAQSEIWWMTSSGVPWDYRYEYVNLGWKNWNAPTGAWAYNYAQQSQASRYVPVFTWYESGSTGLWGQSQLTYLTIPGNMYTYYGDFVLLLQKLAASPVAIVQVEPDLWGFMQQIYWDNPAIIPISVASSGYPGLSWLPNNASGFARALVQLRDTYAPNVILAWHASIWGPNNGYDPTLTSPAYYQTPQVTGARVATFYRNLGASFDMIFHDPSDADSAYKMYVRGQSANTAWWTTNSFTSYLQYIATIYQYTGLKSMLWQVPVGNTLYRSSNNATYHYQDNRAQYFLGYGNVGNIWNYAAQGVIGLLFGGGQWNDADYMDYARDGVTNPSPIGGNTWVATYPDDDGGFLRTATAAYYAAGAVPR